MVYRLVEALGRWGMLDVMLVAILVAMVKLGGLVNIQAGAGLLAFTLLVVTSLLASLMFEDPIPALFPAGLLFAAGWASREWDQRLMVGFLALPLAYLFY